MLIERIGEFGLIERIRKITPASSFVVKGIGDDCAVLKLDKENYQLFTCDMLVEGVDFTRKDNPFLVGRKALGVSVSDIAACAGIPTSALVSLAIPRRLSVAYVDKIYKGLLALARDYKINLVGGDLSRAENIIINVSLLGIVEKRYLVLRKGAKPGDIIFVSGSLGGAAGGRHLTFTPRIREARYLVKNFKVDAMIDISDGLAQDLGHILKQSNSSAVIYEALLPVSEEARGLSDALYAGEDFELLFTLPRTEARRIISGKQKFFKPIGEITEGGWGLRLIDRKDRVKTIKAKGFRHF